jgi:hypothetical protein
VAHLRHAHVDHLDEPLLVADLEVEAGGEGVLDLVLDRGQELRQELTLVVVPDRAHELEVERCDLRGTRAVDRVQEDPDLVVRHLTTVRSPHVVQEGDALAREHLHEPEATVVGPEGVRTNVRVDDQHGDSSHTAVCSVGCDGNNYNTYF